MEYHRYFPSADNRIFMSSDRTDNKICISAPGTDNSNHPRHVPLPKSISGSATGSDFRRRDGPNQSRGFIDDYWLHALNDFVLWNNCLTRHIPTVPTSLPSIRCGTILTTFDEFMKCRLLVYLRCSLHTDETTFCARAVRIKQVHVLNSIAMICS